MPPPILIDARRILLVVAVAAVLLMLLGGACRPLVRHADVSDPRLLALRDLVDPGRESNLPSWLSSIVLAVCSAELLAIGLAERARRGADPAATSPERPAPGAWLALAAVFLLLSLDEAASMHEITTATVRYRLGAGGLLYFAWIVLGAGFALAVFLGSLGLLRRLAAPTRNRFLLAGALYLSGAVGAEAVGGWLFELRRQEPESLKWALLYDLEVVVEEVLEVLGALLFASALARHLARAVGEVRVRVLP